MGVKNALRDWRLPLIFAAPVLLCAAVLYLALQPLAGSATTASIENVTLRNISTPAPSFVPTPYPSVPPAAAVPSTYVLPCSTGVTAMNVSPAVAGGRVTLKVTDQRGKPVVCAWLSQRGGNYGILGETDESGTVSAELSNMPRNSHIVETATLGALSAGVDFFVEH